MVYKIILYFAEKNINDNNARLQRQILYFHVRVYERKINKENNKKPYHWFFFLCYLGLNIYKNK